MRVVARKRCLDPVPDAVARQTADPGPLGPATKLFAAVQGNRAAMDAFVRVNTGVTSPAEFFADENVERASLGRQTGGLAGAAAGVTVSRADELPDRQGLWDEACREQPGHRADRDVDQKLRAPAQTGDMLGDWDAAELLSQRCPSAAPNLAASVDAAGSVVRRRKIGLSADFAGAYHRLRLRCALLSLRLG